LLDLRVRIPPGARMSLSCEYCPLSGVSALGRSLVQRSPIDCCVSECDRATSIQRRLWPTRGCPAGKTFMYVNLIHRKERGMIPFSTASR